MRYTYATIFQTSEMKTDKHQRKFLKDYQPPDFKISRTRLEFHLDASRTRVSSRLQVHRNGANEDADLVLDAGQRAAGLTRQLLAFGRADLAHPRVHDLHRLIGEARPMLERLRTASLTTQAAALRDALIEEVDGSPRGDSA